MPHRREIRTASGRHQAVVGYHERIEAIQHEAEPRLQALNRELEDYLTKIKSDPPGAVEVEDDDVTPVIDLTRVVGRLGSREMRAVDACAVCGRRYPGGTNAPGWRPLAGAKPVGSVVCSGRCCDEALVRQRKYGRVDR